MKTIMIGKISIDLHDGPVGVLVSGGADSAILLYVLLKYLTGPIHVYTVASKLKHRASVLNSANVIGKCIDLTNNSNVIQHVLYVPEQTYHLIHYLSTKDILAKKISVVYTAVSAVPPEEVRKNFTTQSGIDNTRDPTVTRPVYYNNDTIYTPFFNIDKQAIAELYDVCEVKKDLYPLTRSCEDLKLSTGHCGHCYWCQERLWAFGQL